MVELFDDAGQLADGKLLRVDTGAVEVAVTSLRAGTDGGRRIIVASALPKGDRADWMVEKLSELGVHRFIPLAASRSVVLPAGRNKAQRWQRIVIESAKQSRRSGVMEIADLTPLAQAIEEAKAGWYLSTASAARAIHEVLREEKSMTLALFIGPEGGWTDDETAAFEAAEFAAVALTSSILRVETAAVAAAAVVASFSRLQ